MAKIGILALQGAFIEHEKMLDKLNVEHFLIRKRSDLLQYMDGLILPGGVSTAMGKLLDDFGLKEDIRGKISNGLPVFGTCAGMILLGKDIEGSETKHLACMDITVRRNAYGRQLGSFSTVSSFGNTPVQMVFIRAPYIGKAGDDGNIVTDPTKCTMCCACVKGCPNSARVFDTEFTQLLHEQCKTRKEQELFI